FWRDGRDVRHRSLRGVGTFRRPPARYLSIVGMSKSRKQHGVCTYCGAAGPVTDDHIPPQSLFPAGAFVPYVPACRGCNGGSSGDDEHFRAVLTIRDGLDDHVVVKGLLASVVRGLE